MTNTKKRGLICLLVMGALGGCEAAPPGEPQGLAVSHEAIRWEEPDDPRIITDDLVYTLSDLPLSGEATAIPWPGSYWPTFQDSINYRWGGPDTESPAEKYGRAFEVPDMANQVSAHSGILSQYYRTACTSDAACNASVGEACALRRGETQGVCIPTWFGLCHAWAPAAILEPEPQMAVSRNGVVFRVNDLKALLTLAYNEVDTRFVSLRCNQSNAAGDIEYDEWGRPKDIDKECRDTNPGTFHVIMTNYLGLKKLSLVEDRIFDDQVWNQPLRGYTILEQTEVTAQQANALVGVVGETIHRSGAVVQSTWAHLGNYAVQAGQRISVSMTGLGDADLYVRFGAQPTTSRYACRPYLDGSNETCELVVPDGIDRVYVSVRGYSLISSYNVNISLRDSAPAVYRFNPDAARYYYVKADLKYIAESGSGEDGNLAGRIDNFTGIDPYEYVLEVDAANRIIGGEWLNGSKTSHPDFLWLPVRRSAASSSPVDYSTLKGLLNESVGQIPGAEATLVSESGTVAADAWMHFGPFEVAGGSLRAMMTGSQDADLYVRQGARPSAEAFDCRPYLNGSEESCEVAGKGPVYVSVAGYAAVSDFILQISYMKAANP